MARLAHCPDLGPGTFVQIVQGPSPTTTRASASGGLVMAMDDAGSRQIVVDVAPPLPVCSEEITLPIRASAPTISDFGIWVLGCTPNGRPGPASAQLCTLEESGSSASDPILCTPRLSGYASRTILRAYRPASNYIRTRTAPVDMQQCIRSYLEGGRMHFR